LNGGFAVLTAMLGLPILAQPAAAAYLVTLTNDLTDLVLASDPSNGGNTSTGVWAGQISLAPVAPQGGLTELAWCVDLFHNVGVPGTYSYVATPVPSTGLPAGLDGNGNPTAAIGATLLELAAEGNAVLASTTLQAVVAGATGVAFNPDVFGAAVQAAIWDTEYGTAASAADTGFSQDLTYAIDNSGSYSTANGYGPGLVFSDGADGLQTLISNGPSVPEPASAALVMTGLLGFAALRRRRRIPAE
jgi:hypothetical protein